MALTEVELIKNGVIVDADISASAAIDGSKIAPGFGAQNISTTGTITGASLNPTSSTVPTNGVYLPSANNVAISTNGTGRLFVDSSGNVGVGAAASTWNLGRTVEVSGTKSVSLWNPGDGFNALSNAYYNSGYKFATTGGYGLYYQQNTGSGAHIFASSTATGTANGAATFSELARITADGKLGLGTSTPGLTGSNRTAVTINAPTGQLSILELAVNNTLAGYLYSNASLTTLNSQSTPLTFEVQGAERLRIDTQGRVGVGTTSPAELLDVNGKTIVRNALGVGGANYGSSGQVLTSQGSGAAPQWATPAGGAWTYISSVTASNSASVAFTSGLNSTYDIYQITFANVTGTVDNVNFACRFSSDGGASYYSGSSSYNYTEIYSNSTSNSTGTNGYIRLNSLTTISTGYGRTAGYILLYTPAISYKMLFEHRGPDGRDGGWQRANIGRVNVATAINAVQFFGSSGNLEGGTFRLYGLKNS